MARKATISSIPGPCQNCRVKSGLPPQDVNSWTRLALSITAHSRIILKVHRPQFRTRQVNGSHLNLCPRIFKQLPYFVPTAAVLSETAAERLVSPDTQEPVQEHIFGVIMGNAPITATFPPAGVPNPKIYLIQIPEIVRETWLGPVRIKR